MVRLNQNGNIDVVQITDFGAAILNNENIMSGRRGTVEYAAPEIRKLVEYDEKVDVYSYGVILWALARNKQPDFGATAAYVIEQMAYDREKERMVPWLLNNLREDENTEQLFEELIVACIDANPAKRPSFIDILEHVAEY